MDIGVPIKELGQYEIETLQQAILSQPEEAWFNNQDRQNDYEVHQYTHSIVLVFTTGDGWPNIEVTQESGWDLLAEQAIPLMHEILKDHYPIGGTIIRAMAARLEPGGFIIPHTDMHPSFHHGHRIHIPISTNSKVRFMIDGRPYQFEIGNVYEINNQMKHSVMNKGESSRINFIFDYVPPEKINRE